MVEYEHDYEQHPGIPGRLPDGERILWQGAPNWKSLAVRVFHIRLIGLYFGVIALWRLAVGMSDGTALVNLATSVLTAIAMGIVSIALLSCVAWLMQKTTVYTITNKRILMRIGIALSVTLNLPFTKIGTAAIKRFGTRSETGNLSLTTLGDDGLAWLMLWPHARPWKVSPAEPALRCINDIDGVADILATALEKASHERTNETTLDRQKAHQYTKQTHEGDFDSSDLTLSGVVAAE